MINFEKKLDRIFEEGIKTFQRRLEKIKICEETFKKPSWVKLFLQHHLNELHLYCKLVRVGIKKDTAKKVSHAVYSLVKNFIV